MTQIRPAPSPSTGRVRRLPRVRHARAAAVLLAAACSPSSPEPSTAPSPRVETPVAQPAPAAPAGPKGVVFVVGDGTSASQLTAARIRKGAPLHYERFEEVGLQHTVPAGGLLTDSAASATAMATGHKTLNGRIGVDAEGTPHDSVLHAAEAAGLATGLVVTSRVTHATPAAFVAHELSRRDEPAIARDFLDVDLEVVVGGGRDMFDATRPDGDDLTAPLAERGVAVVDGLDAFLATPAPPVYAFTAQGSPPTAASGRAGELSRAALHALDLLSDDPDGFFLLVEGSQVDWGGHRNDGEYMLTELLDLDETVGALLDEATRRGDVLIVATGDHETGGMDVLAEEDDPSAMRLTWNTDDHSAVMVPVFAAGPGAEAFGGVYDNTGIASRLAEALGVGWPVEDGEE